MFRASAAIGISACEIVSGLNGLEPVDCVSCDVASRPDSSGDVAVFDVGVRDAVLEEGPRESGTKAREVDVLDSGDRDLPEGRWDAAADGDGFDAAADRSIADTETSAGDATRSLPDADGSDGDGSRPDSAARCSNRASDCGVCMYVHANGLGQDFSDCTPVGTYNNAQAMSACEAYTGRPTECRSATCGVASVVCSSGETTACACWGFAGAGAGHVSDAAEPGALSCTCPGPAAPTWN